MSSLSRFRFSLRTLFVVVTVVAIPLGWLGYQKHWIRERQKFREACRQQDDDCTDAPCIDAPWSIRWLGETAVIEINLFGLDAEAKADAARRLFPEAQFIEVFPEITFADQSADEADPYGAP